MIDTEIETNWQIIKQHLGEEAQEGNLRDLKRKKEKLRRSKLTAICRQGKITAPIRKWRLFGQIYLCPLCGSQLYPQEDWCYPEESIDGIENNNYSGNYHWYGNHRLLYFLCNCGYEYSEYLGHPGQSDAGLP